MKKQVKSRKAQPRKGNSEASILQAAVIRNKVIFANKERENMYKVYILNLQDSTQEHPFHFYSPLKAMRYAFLIQKRFGLHISDNALQFLSKEYKVFKAKLQERA